METPEMAGEGRSVGSGLGRVVRLWPAQEAILEAVIDGRARTAPEIPVTPEEEQAWIELEHRIGGDTS